MTFCARSSQNCRFSCCSNCWLNSRRRLVVEGHLLQRDFILRAESPASACPARSGRCRLNFFTSSGGRGHGFAVGALAFKALGDEDGGGEALQAAGRLDRCCW